MKNKLQLLTIILANTQNFLRKKLDQEKVTHKLQF